MTVIAKRNVTSIETYTGRFVDLLNPKPEQICLADIAVGLSNACRFGNQVSRFYSVAEHSVRVAEAIEAALHEEAVEESLRNGHGLYERSGQTAFYGLMHDAHEAYTGDITAPMKKTLREVAPFAVQDLQTRLDQAIAAHFGFHYMSLHLPEIKAADDAVMFREAAGLKYSHGIGEHWGNTEYHEPLTDYGWTPAEAERRFLETYRRLTK